MAKKSKTTTTTTSALPRADKPAVRATAPVELRKGGMSMSQAIEAMNGGARVRRAGWQADVYISKTDNRDGRDVYSYNDGRQFAPTDVPLASEDWEVTA